MSTELLEPPVRENGYLVPKISDELERSLIQIFKLLADETRLKILLSLAREGELHVSALCERLGQSQPAVSHHLALLRAAGLLESRRDGKHNFYALQDSRFRKIVGQLLEGMNVDSDDLARWLPASTDV
jgi:ArsR family transcriptional regulator, arsenate/arsenite/antimonite-responsive transcriptional repressor